MEPVVQLRGAVTLLGRFPALAGIDLEVAAGEVVLLRGPNGAGKTTLLRCCAGLVPLTRGEATVLAHDLSDRRQARALRRRVGLLGHATGLYDELTVVDNVRFWGRAAGARPDDVLAAIEACGLGGRLAALPVARLSAGQRRRTALACLVARRPELWLLDEPHVGLDHEGRDLIDDLVLHAKAAGATIVVASHEGDRAEALADRVVTIAGGTIAPPTAADPTTEERILVPDATLVAAKDLRIELRSQVTSQQVAPFAVLVLILFGVALDPDRGVLGRASAGLFWVAVLFCTLLAIQRAFTIEAADGGRDMLRLSGLDPAGIFLGKAAAIFVQLAALEVVLAVGVVLMYGTDITGVPLLVATCVAATAGLAAAGTLYGVLAAGLRVRETLLPILLLPVLAPVLIGATEAFEAALGGVATDGWPWCGLLVTFALLYTTFGTLAFGTLLEEP